MWSHPSSSLSQCSAMFSTPAEHVDEKILSPSPMWRTARPNNAFALRQSSTCIVARKWHRVTPPNKYMSLLTVSWTHLWRISIAEAHGFQTRISSGQVATLDFEVHSHSPWRQKFWMTSPNVQFLTGKSGWKSWRFWLQEWPCYQG